MIGSALLSIFDISSMLKIGTIDILGNSISYGYSINIIVIALYFILFDFFNNGTTWGKLVFSIYVVEKNKLIKLSVKKSLKRSFFKIVGIVILPVSMALFILKKGFTLEDYFTDTITIINE